MNFVAGSFFEQGSIPRAEKDNVVYTMRQILHDWSDGDSVKILKEVSCPKIGQQVASCAVAAGDFLAYPKEHIVGDFFALAHHHERTWYSGLFQGYWCDIVDSSLLWRGAHRKSFLSYKVCSHVSHDDRFIQEIVQEAPYHRFSECYP